MSGLKEITGIKKGNKRNSLPKIIKSCGKLVVVIKLINLATIHIPNARTIKIMGSRGAI